MLLKLAKVLKSFAVKPGLRKHGTKLLGVRIKLKKSITLYLNMLDCLFNKNYKNLSTTQTFRLFPCKYPLFSSCQSSVIVLRSAWRSGKYKTTFSVTQRIKAGVKSDATLTFSELTENSWQSYGNMITQTWASMCSRVIGSEQTEIRRQMLVNEMSAGQLARNGTGWRRWLTKRFCLRRSRMTETQVKAEYLNCSRTPASSRRRKPDKLWLCQL